jgi:hypothetical protein
MNSQLIKNNIPFTHSRYDYKMIRFYTFSMRLMLSLKSKMLWQFNFFFVYSFLYHNMLVFYRWYMVRVRTSCSVDRGFEPWSGQTKDYAIGISCFSAKHAVLRRKAKSGWFGIRIMCPSGATCLPSDCCFSELVLYKSNSACCSRTKRTSSSFIEN